MIRRRVAVVLLILFAAVLYLFANGTGTVALLAALIAAPLLSLAAASISGKHVEASLLQDTADANSIRLILHNPDLMPVAGAEAEVRCTNLRTGEVDTINVLRHLRPKGRSEEQLVINPGHAGRYEVAVDNVRISDPLHLWSRNKAVSDRHYITVMPELFDMDLQLTSSSASMPESDIYRDDRRGSDPGDVRGLREYIVGDPVRNTHWKLSEKVDKMLVKELGTPVTGQVLVILDNAADVGLNPYALDVIASVFASVMNSLWAAGVDFTAGWTDPETREPVYAKVTNEEELLSIADAYLSVPAVSNSAFEVIERGTVDSRFAHLIIVGSKMPSGIESISNGCQVTLLMYDAAREGRNEAGANIIRIDENSYTSELSELEI